LFDKLEGAYVRFRTTSIPALSVFVVVLEVNNEFRFCSFESSVAPTDRNAFLAWYDRQTEWEESHGYDDPEVSTPSLRYDFLK
jgi:hypothetical protein